MQIVSFRWRNDDVGVQSVDDLDDVRFDGQHCHNIAKAFADCHAQESGILSETRVLRPFYFQITHQETAARTKASSATSAFGLMYAGSEIFF